MPENIPPQIDFAILTAKIEEFDAVRSLLNDPHPWPGTDDDPNKYNWTLGSIGKAGSEIGYRVVLSMTHVQTSVPAASAARDTIEKFRPRWVAFVGIAGSLRDSIEFGDVVFAENVWQYTVRNDKLVEARHKLRWPVADGLLPSATDFANRNHEWNELGVPRPDDTTAKPRVHFKGIASGDHVVQNVANDFFDSIRKADPDAGAIETEGGGVAFEVQRQTEFRKIGLMIVRGISDVPAGVAEHAAGSVAAVNNREDRKAWTLYAAAAAASFTIRYVAEMFPYPPLDAARTIHTLGREPHAPKVRMVRSDEGDWLETFADFLDDSVGMIALTGRAGRGKSHFAWRLLDTIKQARPSSVHFWLNCNYYMPERTPFRELFRQHPGFHDAEAAGSASTNASMLAALSYLGSHVYLYLDDMDRANIRALDRFSFLREFLLEWKERPGSLRIIATVKDDAYLPGLRDVLAGNIPLKEMEIPELTTGESQDYFRDARIKPLVSSSELSTLIRVCEGEPLVMTLLEEECAKQSGEVEKKAYLAGILKVARELEATRDRQAAPEPESAPRPSDALRREIFVSRLKRIRDTVEVGADGVVKNTDYRVLVALAVLYPEYGSEDVLADSIVVRVASRVQSNLPAIDEAGLQPALLYLNLSDMLNGKRYRADTGRRILYEELRAEEPQLLSSLHRTAAEAFVEHGHPDYAGWHYSKAGLVDLAFRQIENAAPDLAGIYDWDSLDTLYKELTRSIDEALETVGKSGAIGRTRQGYDRLLLENLRTTTQANVAEMLYQNEADEWEAEYTRIIKTISSGLEHRVHGNEEAYIQVSALQTMHDFDWGEMGWEELCDSTKPLVEMARKLKCPTIEANLLTNLGVYYNRGFQTEEALKAYDRALELLLPLRTQWRASSYESEHLEQDVLRIVVNRSRSVFLSEAAQRGPGPAISGLAKEMERVDTADSLAADSVWKSSRHRRRASWMEYSYGGVNLCFFNLCRNNVEVAHQSLKKCFDGQNYDNIDEMLTKEPWIRACALAMRGALMLYRGVNEKRAVCWDTSETAMPNYLGAIHQFDECAKLFDAMEIPRDVSFMAVNSVSAQVCQWLEETDTLSTEQYEQAMAKLGAIPAPVLAEPIAGNVVSYLRWRLAPPDYPNPPAIDPLVKVWVEEHMGPLMDNTGGERGGRTLRQRWAPPMILRGALVLRAKPLAPASTALTEGAS